MRHNKLHLTEITLVLNIKSKWPENLTECFTGCYACIEPVLSPAWAFKIMENIENFRVLQKAFLKCNFRHETEIHGILYIIHF